MPKRKQKTLSNSVIINSLKGFIAGIIVFIFLLIVFSLVIWKNVIDNNLYFIFIFISAGISAFIGALISSITAKRTRLLNGLLTAIILNVVEFILLLCFNNAALSVKIYFLFPISIFMGTVGGVIGSNIRRK